MDVPRWNMQFTCFTIFFLSTVMLPKRWLILNKSFRKSLILYITYNINIYIHIYGRLKIDSFT